MRESHSISAGLDYPGVGPELATSRDSGRAEYVPATDAEAMAAFELCARPRASSPRSSRPTPSPAPTPGAEIGPDATILVNLSGRGDKDVHTAAEWFGLLDGPVVLDEGVEE